MVIPLSSEVITICKSEEVWSVGVVWDVLRVFLIDSGVVDPFCFLAANAKNKQLTEIKKSYNVWINRYNGLMTC